MRRGKTGQLATDAVLAATCLVLGYLSVDLGFVKITFEGLPVLLGALLLGPASGMIAGAAGTFLSQFLRYGLTATTLLWMLPYVAAGFMAGRYALRRGFKLGRKQLFFIIIVTEIAVSLLNTGVLFADSLIYGYYTGVYVFGMLILRIPISLGKALGYGALIPALIGSLRRGLNLWPEEIEENEIKRKYKFGHSVTLGNAAGDDKGNDEDGSGHPEPDRGRAGFSDPAADL